MPPKRVSAALNSSFIIFRNVEPLILLDLVQKWWFDVNNALYHFKAVVIASATIHFNQFLPDYD